MQRPISPGAALSSTGASLALDATRALAAQAVVIGHAISFFGVWRAAQPPFSPYMQNIAVQVFFVLSGFLIAHALSRKGTFTEYLIDRFARIYSAYAPALLFVAAVDTLLVAAGRYDLPRHHLTMHVLLGNLLMVQNLVVPTLGSGGPFWTLMVEWHLYLFAGALWFVRRSPWLIVVALAAAVVPLRYLASASVDPGRGLTWLWLAGFVAYLGLPWLRRLPLRIVAPAAAVAAAAYLTLLTPGREYQPLLYPLLALAFAGLVLTAMRARPWGAAWTSTVRFFADYSFTLYLVHHTVVYAMQQWWDGSPAQGAAASVLAANAVALALAMPTEMKHRAVAKLLKRRYSVRAG